MFRATPLPFQLTTDHARELAREMGCTHEVPSRVVTRPDAHDGRADWTRHAHAGESYADVRTRLGDTPDDDDGERAFYDAGGVADNGGAVCPRETLEAIQS